MKLQDYPCVDCGEPRTRYAVRCAKCAAKLAAKTRQPRRKPERKRSYDWPRTNPFTKRMRRLYAEMFSPFEP